MTDSPATYESRRRSLTNLLQSHPAYDWLVSLYQNTRLSARKIAPFIRKQNIDMEEFEPGPYHTYADFFDRAFKPGARPFPKEPHIMGAFAEARYFGWKKLQPDQNFPIKGARYAPATCSEMPSALNPSREVRSSWRDWLLSITTTCTIPMMEKHSSTKASATDSGPSIEMPFKTSRTSCSATRKAQILATTNFGRLGFVEIGALSVGRTVQMHPLDRPFRRGAQKSVFRFGGSAVVMFGEPGAWSPSEDILGKTGEGVETFVRLRGELALSPVTEGKARQTGYSSIHV
jgi:phosphatidylserine decarboxylase